MVKVSLTPRQSCWNGDQLGIDDKRESESQDWLQTNRTWRWFLGKTKATEGEEQDGGNGEELHVGQSEGFFLSCGRKDLGIIWRKRM